MGAVLGGVVGLSGTERLPIVRWGTGGVTAMGIDTDMLRSIGRSGAATPEMTLAMACGMGSLRLAGGAEATRASATLAEVGGIAETLPSCGMGGVAAPMPLVAMLPGEGTMRGVVTAPETTAEEPNGGTTMGIGPLVIL